MGFHRGSGMVGFGLTGFDWVGLAGRVGPSFVKRTTEGRLVRRIDN